MRPKARCSSPAHMTVLSAFWSTEIGECVQVIRNHPGLIVFGCDMRNLHADSEVDKDVLRQDGALVD